MICSNVKKSFKYFHIFYLVNITHYMFYPGTMISSSKILYKCHIVLLFVTAELIIGTDIFIIQGGKL